MIFSTNSDSHPFSIAIEVDFHEDIFHDTAVSNYGINKIAVFLNNGNETFLY